MEKEKVYSVEMTVRLVVRAKDEQTASRKGLDQCMALDGIERVRPVMVEHPASGSRFTPDQNGKMRPA